MDVLMVFDNEDVEHIFSEAEWASEWASEEETPSAHLSAALWAVVEAEWASMDLR